MWTVSQPGLIGGALKDWGAQDMPENGHNLIIYANTWPSPHTRYPGAAVNTAESKSLSYLKNMQWTSQISTMYYAHVTSQRAAS